jgi:hypothetical protein
MAYDNRLKKIQKVAEAVQALVNSDEEIKLRAFNTNDDEDGFLLHVVLQVEKKATIL